MLSYKTFWNILHVSFDIITDEMFSIVVISWQIFIGLVINKELTHAVDYLYAEQIFVFMYFDCYKYYFVKCSACMVISSVFFFVVDSFSFVKYFNKRFSYIKIRSY